MGTKVLDASGYDTDKAVNVHYLRNYEALFSPLVHKDIRLFELGVRRGGSLLLWRDYFPQGMIAGLDLEPVSVVDPSGRIRIYQGRQEDTALLDRIARETAPGGFDIIIDDCSHIGELTRATFRHLFDRHLKPGGIYVIEDWGTGYWQRWPDGAAFQGHAEAEGIGAALLRAFSRLAGRKVAKKFRFRRRFPSHDYGMVGFVKELVDECGMGDATSPGRGAGTVRSSKFARMIVSHGQVVIIKAGPAEAASLTA
jgi:SAM-dependent methyltransferase